MEEKYCTYDGASYIGKNGNTSTPIPSYDIQLKLITKENLSTYYCKVSETADINYTNKQCVLKKDVVPINSGEVKLILSTEFLGMLDAGGEFGFTIVENPGPYEIISSEDGVSYYYPTEVLDVLFPYNNTTTTYYNKVCGGSTYYVSGGKGYVKYGMGIGGYFTCYSHATGNNIVYMDIYMDIHFADGTMEHRAEKTYPISSTIEYQDKYETVYKHDFEIHYNEVTGPGFINCGAKQVKEIMAIISIYGDA